MWYKSSSFFINGKINGNLFVLASLEIRNKTCPLRKGTSSVRGFLLPHLRGAICLKNGVSQTASVV